MPDLSDLTCDCRKNTGVNKKVCVEMHTFTTRGMLLFCLPVMRPPAVYAQTPAPLCYFLFPAFRYSTQVHFVKLRMNFDAQLLGQHS